MCQQFAGLGVAQIARQNLADQVFARYPQTLYPSLDQILDMFGFHPLTSFQKLAVINHDVEAGGFTLQAFGDQIQGEMFAIDTNEVGFEE